MDQETKDKLITAADQLFSERGYAATSIRDIVSKAGTNLGAVTYHFGGKEKLFAELIRMKIEPMRKLGMEIASTQEKASIKLQQLLEEYSLYVLHTDPGLKVIFAELLAGGTHLPEEVTDAVSFRNHLFKRILRDGVEDGEFRDLDFDEAPWIFFGMLSAYILYRPLMHADKRNAPYPEKYARKVGREAVDIFLKGILSK